MNLQTALYYGNNRFSHYNMKEWYFELKTASDVWKKGEKETGKGKRKGEQKKTRNWKNNCMQQQNQKLTNEDNAKTDEPAINNGSSRKGKIIIQ